MREFTKTHHSHSCSSLAALCEPYNDARRNLIMALIFASRDTINEVTIFFHDRLLRACRATKV